MQTLNINLPDTIDISRQDVLTAVATRLYDVGRINLEQAAQLAGYDEARFIEELMGQSLAECTLPIYKY